MSCSCEKPCWPRCTTPTTISSSSVLQCTKKMTAATTADSDMPTNASTANRASSNTVPPVYGTSHTRCR